MALLSFRVPTPMRRIVSALFAAAILVPADIAGQPSIAMEYGDWTMMGSEDPMDGWHYFVGSGRVYPLRPMGFPYSNAALSITWACDVKGQGIWFNIYDAPRIGRFRRWNPPAEWYLKDREISRYETYEQRQEKQLVLERRVFVRVRWDAEPPTELRGSLLPSGHILSMFIDPLAVDGSIEDPVALSDFVSKLSRHTTLLVEIPWADPQLLRSHFRIPLDGAAEGIEETQRRCPDLRER